MTNKTNWWDEFRANFTALRAGAKMTQNAIGGKIGISGPAVSHMETGQRYPTVDILVRTSKLFKISTDELLGLDDQDGS